MKKLNPARAGAAVLSAAIARQQIERERPERGAGLAEYGLLGLLIAVAAIGALGTLSGAVNAAYTTASGMFN